MKNKIGILIASTAMMSFLVPTSALASIAASFPDASDAAIQMIISIPGLIGIIAALLVSRLTKRMYKRTIILICTLIYLIAGPMPFFFHSSLAQILFFAALMGVGMGGMLTCVAALICDCFEGRERSTLMGMQAAFISGGGCIFSFLGGQLGKLHWEYSFLAYYAVVITLVVEFFCLPKGRLAEQETAIAGRAPLEGKKVQIGENSDHLAQKGRKKLLSGIPGNVIFLGSIGLLFYAFIAVYNTNISMLVTQRSFGATAEASYASMSYTFAGMLAGFAVGKIMDRLNHKTIPFSLALAVLGLMICVLSTNLIFLCIGGMLCGAAFSIFTPAGNYYAVEKSAPDQQAFHISLFSSASNLGMALSPILIGTLSALLHTGITIKFVLAALVCALLGVIALKKYREKQ